MDKPKNVQTDKKRIDKLSTFLIALVILLLLNIVVVNFALRLDLTSQKMYSISKASKRVVRELVEPLTVKVFFSEELPPPYNTYERYLRDFLREYRNNSKGKFRYEFVNVEENPEAPRSYGIGPVQIRVLEKDKATFRKAYIGAAFLYGNVVQTIPRIESTEGLEYEITSIIKRMTEKLNKLQTLENNIQVLLFASSSILSSEDAMRLDHTVSSSVDDLKEKLLGKIEYQFVDPASDNAPEKALKLAEEYGVPEPVEEGYIGVVVAKGGEYEVVNILVRNIFGQLSIANLDELGIIIEDVVDNLIGLDKTVAYLTGHGEPSEFSRAPNPMQQGQQEDPTSVSKLASMVNEDYSFESITIDEYGIPSDADALFVLGATRRLSDYELYEIDQYIMKGKPVAFILSGIDFPKPPPQMQQFQRQQPPRGVAVSTGLEFLLSHYGVKLNNDIVLDKNCFERPMPQEYGGGSMLMYYIPILKQKGIDNEHPITKRIKGMYVAQASTIEPVAKALSNGVEYMSLMRTSEKSWTEGPGVMLNPYFLQPPDEKTMKSYDIAAVLKGRFDSYYNGKEIPVYSSALASNAAQNENANLALNIEDDGRAGFVSSTEEGRIFVFTSVECARNYFLDPRNEPNVVFMRNVVDWMAADTDLLHIRNKGLTFNPPRELSEVSKNVIRIVNVAGLPILVIVIGLLLWRFDAVRRKRIKDMFNK